VREGGELEQMPTGLNALLGARLDQLGLEARDALERGAVEGELFHQAAIVELSDELARPAVPGELGQLARKDLIRLAAAGLIAGGVAYRFKHILVREAAYLATAKKLRALLHERYADWLEQVVGGRVGEYHEIIGYHLEQAYRYRSELGALDEGAASLAARAAGHLAAAGRLAAARGDYHAVANLLERALALGISDRHERVRLQVALGKALWEVGRIGESEALLAATRDAATGLAERALAERALVQSLDIRLFSDPALGSAEVVPVAEAAIETFAALGDTLGLAEAEELLGQALTREGRNEEARAARERALVHAQAAGALGLQRRIVARLASNLRGGWTTVDEAIGRHEELISSSRDDRVLEAQLGRGLAVLHARAGRFDEARTQLAASAAVLDETEGDNITWTSRFQVAEAKRLMGDDAGAEQEFIAVFLHFRDTRVEGPEARALQSSGRLALLYCDQGRWDEAADYLAYGQEVDRSPPAQGKVYVYLRLAARARVAAHLRRHTEAVELAHTALDMVERRNMPGEGDWARVLLAFAEVQRAAGNTTDADAAVAKALAFHEQKGNITAAARLRDEHNLASPA
jgi:tetratricopeptide (TPR) repeat protein